MNKNLILFGMILAVGGIVFSMWLYASKLNAPVKQAAKAADASQSVVTFPFSLGNIGPELVKAGVVDTKKFNSQYLSAQTGPLVITSANAPEMLNVLWAFGLGNKNEILEKGPMMDPKYGGAGGFASTGGWTIGAGNAMNHYSHHRMVMLDEEQQGLVNAVSKTIFRPCCKNPAYFPDCNHGMAMLGLLELMAANGMNEQQMKQAANEVNAKWFPGYQNSSCAV